MLFTIKEASDEHCPLWGEECHGDGGQEERPDGEAQVDAPEGPVAQVAREDAGEKRLCPAEGEEHKEERHTHKERVDHRPLCCAFWELLLLFLTPLLCHPFFFVVVLRLRRPAFAAADAVCVGLFVLVALVPCVAAAAPAHRFFFFKTENKIEIFNGEKKN